MIGGGVIGCAVAERLARNRHQVILLERDQLAGRASGAAAGELSPQTTTSRAEASALESLALFPDLVARIEKDSGMSIEFRLQQGLQPAFTEDEAVRIREAGGRWLGAGECRELEPALNPEILGANLVEHAHLTPPRFVRALARAASVHGAEICEGTPATGFEVSGGEIRRVISSSGSHELDWAVIAAGPWTKEVAARAGLHVDVKPQRGQLAALDPGAVRLSRSVFWSGGYLVPKADGSIIAGGTEEDAGFDDRPTAGGIAGLLTFACKLVPGLATASLTRTWAGLRPVTPGGEPIVGTMGLPNLIIATGHHRKGILLAPLAAIQVATIIERA